MMNLKRVSNPPVDEFSVQFVYYFSGQSLIIHAASLIPKLKSRQSAGSTAQQPSQAAGGGKKKKR